MPPKVDLLPPGSVLRPPQEELRPPVAGGRKSDLEAGFRNADVAAAWGLSKGRVSHKWPGFCESLLAAYRSIGRHRLQQWLAHLQAGENYDALSNDELGLIWQRAPGFVREHRRRPFEANMLGLHTLDSAGFWLLISELDFRDRLQQERTTRAIGIPDKRTGRI